MIWKIRTGISLTLFSIGTFLILSTESGVTGAVIGTPIQSTPIMSLVFMVAGVLALAGGNYDADVKAYRKHIEKETGTKISYVKAEHLFNDAVQRYGAAIEKKIIQHNGIKAIDEFQPEGTIDDQVGDAPESAKKEETLNYAGIALKEKRVYSTPKELLKAARECGYQVGGRSNDGTIIEKDGKKLTNIPGHDISRNTAVNIMKALASGESNFRKQYKKN
ncbi:MAG: hypothetical protein ABIB43_03775 [archaeon]